MTRRKELQNGIANICLVQLLVCALIRFPVQVLLFKSPWFKPGWSNFCTLVGHFSKLFEFAGLSRLKIPIFVPKSGCSLKKKKKVFTWNRSPKFLFWRKIIAFFKKKLRLLLLIDKTCAKLICGMRPASP